MKKLNKIIIGALYASPFLALAQGTPSTGVQSPGVTSVNGVFYLLQNLVNWFFVIVLLIAVAMFIWAGLTYITAGGDSGKVEEAKNRIIYGVVGVAVALMAQVFIWLAASLTNQTGVNIF